MPPTRMAAVNGAARCLSIFLVTCFQGCCGPAVQLASRTRCSSTLAAISNAIGDFLVGFEGMAKGDRMSSIGVVRRFGAWLG